MSSAVTVLVPLTGASVELPSTLESVEEFLHAAGFDFTSRVLDRRDGDGWGAMVRRGVAEAKESIVVVADPELPYRASAIGDAVAMIDSGSTEIVYGRAGVHAGRRGGVPPPAPGRRPYGRRDDGATSWLLRKLLVDLLPDPRVHLAAFSWDAARLLFGESKLSGGGCAAEVAYLANKYGFRIERLHVDAEASPKRAFGG